MVSVPLMDFTFLGNPEGIALEFGHRPLNSLAEANPEGCQRVAGGRSGQGGNDRRKAASESEHPGGVPEVLAPIEKAQQPV
jgi:hypothetical protein